MEQTTIKISGDTAPMRAMARVIILAVLVVPVACSNSNDVRGDGGMIPEGCTSADECNDGISCTNDTCSPSGVCVYTIAPALCPVGSSCNLQDGCVAGAPCADDADCVDADPCTVNEECNPVSRTCVFTILDGDGDGQPPTICGGSDCDDSRGDIAVGAIEDCGPEDRNCNGLPNDVDPATLASDRSNCGACGVVCPEYCDNGACRNYGETGGQCRWNPGNECDDPLAVCIGANFNVSRRGRCELATCGRASLPCCTGSTPCQVPPSTVGSVECMSGTCVACGSEGQPCCEGDWCTTIYTEHSGWRSCTSNVCTTDPTIDDSCSPGSGPGPDDAESAHRPGQCRVDPTMSAWWPDDYSLNDGSGWYSYEIILGAGGTWTCCNQATAECEVAGSGAFVADGISYDSTFVMTGSSRFSGHTFVVESETGTMARWSSSGDWYLLVFATPAFAMNAYVYKDGPSDTMPNETWLCEFDWQ